MTAKKRSALVHGNVARLLEWVAKAPGTNPGEGNAFATVVVSKGQALAITRGEKLGFPIGAALPVGPTV